MKFANLIAAALLALTLNACVGVIVPIPLPASSGTSEPDRNDRR